MDPYRFVGYLKIFGRLTLIWPLDAKISRREFVFNNCIWFTIIILNILSISSMLTKVALTDYDPVAISKLLSIIFIAGDSCLHIISMRIQWPRLQILIHEVATFLKSARFKEKIVCRKYMKRYLSYQCILVVTWIAAVMHFLCSPVTLGKRFPIDAWYPFSTDPCGNRIFVYIVQYIMILESLALLSGDCLIIVLLWYAAAKFKLLGTDFHNVRTANQLRNCVTRHVELIRFVKETEYAISLTIMKNLGIVSVIVVLAGLLLSHHRDTMTLLQFFLIVLAAIVRLFVCAWVADDLTETAARLSWAIYHSPALNRPLDLRNSISIVIQRSHRFLGIKLWGFNLNLSLAFFTQYLLKVISFYMTLRAIVDRYI